MMPAALNKLKRGVALEEFTTKPAEVELIGIDRNISTVKIKIREGKTGRCRRMFEAVGHEVLYLRRTQVGSYHAGQCAAGQMAAFEESGSTKANETIGEKCDV